MREAAVGERRRVPESQPKVYLSDTSTTPVSLTLEWLRSRSLKEKGRAGAATIVLRAH